MRVSAPLPPPMSPLLTSDSTLTLTFLYHFISIFFYFSLDFLKTLILFTENNNMPEYHIVLLFTIYFANCKQSMRVCYILIYIPPYILPYAWVCVWICHNIPRFMCKLHYFSHLVCKVCGFPPPPPPMSPLLTSASTLRPTFSYHFISIFFDLSLEFL